MRIAVVGAGGVGGFYGARLAEAGGDVVLVARGEHLEAIRRRGLELRSAAGVVRVPVEAAGDPSEIGPCDAVLFCVKSYDAEEAAGALEPLVGESTAIVPLLNGIDHLDLLSDAVGAEHVLGGTAAVFAERVGPGVIAHHGGPDTITFGELDGSRSVRAERLLEVSRAAGIADDLSHDILSLMWRKLAFICAQAGLTAATRLPLGEIRSTPEAWELYDRVLGEVLAVARAEGVSLRDETGEQLRAFAQELDAGVYSSLHDDLVNGRRMELDAVHGAVLRRARRHGVPVPACETIHALLAPWAERNAPRQGRRSGAARV
jgi:2-dehydropantoate 2-reductase